MSVFVILNHDLTQDQREELEERFGEIVELNAEEKALWSQIPSEGGHLGVNKHIWPILLKIKKYDAVVCQGEFTAFVVVFTSCQTLQKNIFVACSKRETVETIDEDGSIIKKAVFKHVQFRRVPMF